MKTKKGFTLLELLIVIGILAILSTTVVLVINPAQLLKKARDSQRISDLNTVKTAIAYYITEASDPDIGDLDTTTTYSDVTGVICSGGSADSSVLLTTGGSGWIPIDFDSGLAGGSPIGSLPSDPNPTLAGEEPGRYYVYMVGDTTNYTFKLVANLESTYYSTGDGDVESKDGGDDDTLYEVGTDMDTAILTGATCYQGTGV